jgi:hypothetical protein
MTTFGDAMRKASGTTKPQRPRTLRALRVDEISSVDRAANPHATVVLTKRNQPQEVTKMATGKCPYCGHEDDMREFEKMAKATVAADDTVIAKASRAVLDDITATIMKNNPQMSRAQAEIQATMSAEYSAAHVAERKMRLGF